MNHFSIVKATRLKKKNNKYKYNVHAVQIKNIISY